MEIFSNHFVQDLPPPNLGLLTVSLALNVFNVLFKMSFSTSCINEDMKVKSI